MSSFFMAYTHIFVLLSKLSMAKVYTILIRSLVSLLLVVNNHGRLLLTTNLHQVTTYALNITKTTINNNKNISKIFTSECRTRSWRRMKCKRWIDNGGNSQLSFIGIYIYIHIYIYCIWERERKTARLGEKKRYKDIASEYKMLTLNLFVTEIIIAISFYFIFFFISAMVTKPLPTFQNPKKSK